MLFFLLLIPFYNPHVRLNVHAFVFVLLCLFGLFWVCFFWFLFLFAWLAGENSCSISGFTFFCNSFPRSWPTRLRARSAMQEELLCLFGCPLNCISLLWRRCFPLDFTGALFCTPLPPLGGMCFCLNFVAFLHVFGSIFWCTTSSGAYGHSVFNTFVQLTEGRSARDLPKQPPAKKTSIQHPLANPDMFYSAIWPSWIQGMLQGFPLRHRWAQWISRIKFRKMNPKPRRDDLLLDSKITCKVLHLIFKFLQTLAILHGSLYRMWVFLYFSWNLCDAEWQKGFHPFPNIWEYIIHLANPNQTGWTLSPIWCE